MSRAAIFVEALNKTAEAEAVIADYEARLADLQQQLGEERPAVSVVRFLPGQVHQGRLRPWSGRTVAGNPHCCAACRAC